MRFLGRAARQAGSSALYLFVNLNAVPGVKESILQTQEKKFWIQCFLGDGMDSHVILFLRWRRNL